MRDFMKSELRKTALELLEECAHEDARLLMERLLEIFSPSEMAEFQDTQAFYNAAEATYRGQAFVLRKVDGAWVCET